MYSQGLLKNIVDISYLKIVREECLNFLLKNTHIDNYSSEISNYSKNVNLLINKKIQNKISELLNINNPELCSVELHIQRANCKAIPPHQDNFYHCIDYDKGLKILIPLQDLSIDNGGLVFVNKLIDQPILKHSPSKIPNFSAYIDQNTFNILGKDIIPYNLKVGDASYHFINSIHYSLGNKTSQDTMFLVFRYQVPDAKIDKSAEKRYQECYQQHLNFLGKTNT